MSEQDKETMFVRELIELQRKYKLQVDCYFDHDDEMPYLELRTYDDEEDEGNYTNLVPNYLGE